ncbi:MAG TPA: hypothetical protein VK052_04600 [Zeimonas sp.]|nr:hypothetical protein [Zeimonas sp.]
MVFVAKTGPLLANATAVLAKARAACGWRASCAAEKRRSAGPRAKRASFL